MKYWLEGNELVIKKLFGKKSYSFREISKIVCQPGFEMYVGEDCIIKETNFYNGWKNIIDKEKFYHIIAENNIIFEDNGYYGEEYVEINVGDEAQFCVMAMEEMKKILPDYVHEVLGIEYELIISTEETAYHRTFFFDVYKDGMKMCANDQNKMKHYGKYFIVNGRKEYHQASILMISPKHINPGEQKYVLYKYAGYQSELEEVKYEIDEMKRWGMVPASDFGFS